jgi:hypothetical protein
MAEYKPETVPAAFRDRKGRIDEAIEGEGLPKPQKEKKAVEKEAGLPKPGLLDKLKGMVTGKPVKE